MYTAKTVSSVNSAFCPSASRRSAQCAYASNNSRNARRSAASAGVSSEWTAIEAGSLESDQVDAGKRVVDLLHVPSCGQAAEVDCGEPCILEQGDDLGFCLGVVAGDEDHAATAGLLRVRAEHFGSEGICGLHDARAGNEVGDELARRSPVQIVGSPVVGRVDHRLPLPVDALDGLRDAAPRYGDHDDAGNGCLLRRSRRHAIAKL